MTVACLKRQLLLVVLLAACRPSTLIGSTDLEGVDNSTIGENLGDGALVVVEQPVVNEEAPAPIVETPTPPSPPLPTPLITPMLGSLRAGMAHHTIIDGNIGYVALGFAGIGVVGLSIPSAPRFLATVKDLGFVVHLARSGNRLFAACDAGVAMIDISNPQAAIVLDAVGTGDYVHHLQVVGNTLYAAVGGKELWRFDATTFEPLVADPVSVDTFVVDANTGDIYIAFETKVRMYDNTLDPLAWTIDGGTKTCLALVGSLVYACAETEIAVYDFTNTYPGEQIERITDFPMIELASDIDVQSNGLAFVTDSAGGFTIVDVVDPSNPEILSEWSIAGAPLSVLVKGNLAFISDYATGLHIVEVADPTRVELVAHVELAPAAADLDIVGDHLILSDPYSGLIIMDAVTREVITRQSNFGFGKSYGMLADGDRYFVAMGDLGVGVLHSQTLELIGALPVYGDGLFMTIAGGVIYVADADHNLRAFDSTDFSEQTGHDYGLDLSAVVAHGDSLFIAGESKILRASLATLQEQDAFTTTEPTYFRELMIAGDLIIAAASNGIYAINSADLSLAWFTPFATAEYDYMRAVVIGDHVYAATGTDLSVLSLATGAPIASATLSGGIYALSAYGSYLLASYATEGYEVLDAHALLP